jgi:predicted unusual protein kinase regulating ubiquinone biosynthesis (AarF/ABC1/UbiB family)
MSGPSLPRRKSPVPAGRLGRLLGFGLLAGDIALGTAIEAVRRLAGVEHGQGTGSLFSARNAAHLAERLARLRGAAMKLGQMFSMQSEDLLPPELARALATLRADAYAMPRSQLRRVLGREYGRGWESRFAHFEYEPIAAASIGQVHRARAADGRDVALKVQYPGVAKAIDSDVDNARILLRLLDFLPVQLDVEGIAAEAKRQLHEEADYLAEAAQLRRYRLLVADEPRLVVPRVHADLTTRRVLAMDYTDGIALDRLGGEGVVQAERDRVGALLERLLFRELFEFHFMQTDPNFANYLYQPGSGRVALLDFGSVRRFSRAFVARYARITRAIMQGDRNAALTCAAGIGYVQPDDDASRAQATLDLLFLVCEPLRHRGPYDFAASDLALRAGQLTFLPGLTAGTLRLPPPETMFLHRKLVGSFLLCARIRARVDVRALVQPFLTAY